MLINFCGCPHCFSLSKNKHRRLTRGYFFLQKIDANGQ